MVEGLLLKENPTDRRFGSLCSAWTCIAALRIDFLIIHIGFHNPVAQMPIGALPPAQNQSC